MRRNAHDVHSGGIWWDLDRCSIASDALANRYAQNIYLPFALHVSTHLSVFSSQDFVEHISSQKKKIRKKGTRRSALKASRLLARQRCVNHAERRDGTLSLLAQNSIRSVSTADRSVENALLNANPHDAHHNVHPLALAALVLETPHPVALVVPVRAARAVHAAASNALLLNPALF